MVDELEIPETTTVRTPRQGRHIYLVGNSPTRTAIRPGLDVRGVNGYVLGPGSRIGDRPYEWITPPWEVPPQPAPPEVLELVRERVRQQAFDTGPIPEGRRSHGLVQVAGFFVGHGVRGEPLALALQAINRRPMQAAADRKGGRKDREESASKWNHAPPWVIDPLTFVEDHRLDTKAHMLLLALAQRADADGHGPGRRSGFSGRPAFTGTASPELAADLEQLGRIRGSSEKSRKANLYRLLTGSSPQVPRVPSSKGAPHEVVHCLRRGGVMDRRRPTSVPSVAAPLDDTTCTCPEPDPIRIGKTRRCRSCAGIVERQGRLDTRPEPRSSPRGPVQPGTGRGTGADQNRAGAPAPVASKRPKPTSASLDHPKLHQEEESDQPRHHDSWRRRRAGRRDPARQRTSVADGPPSFGPRHAHPVERVRVSPRSLERNATPRSLNRFDATRGKASPFLLGLSGDRPSCAIRGEWRCRVRFRAQGIRGDRFAHGRLR